jgi:hypothetical protein
MIKPDEKMSQTLFCKHCGAPDAVRLGEDLICLNCYAAAGSCCLEFGGDDLWQESEKEAPKI